MNETILYFLLDLANVAIGAFLGFLLAMYLQNRTDIKSRQNKINIVIMCIREELQDITSSLQQYIDMNKPFNKKIQTPSWDAILSTGILLELIDKPIYIYAIKTYSLLMNFNKEPAQSDNDKLCLMKEIVESAKIITDSQVKTLLEVK